MSRCAANALSCSRLRKRLMAAVLLAATPLLVLVGMLILDRVFESRSGLTERNTTMARQIGFALSSHLDNLRERQTLLLDACSPLQAESGPQAHMTEKILRDLRSQWVIGCSVFGTDGQLLCTTGTRSGYVPLFDISPLEPVLSGDIGSMCLIATHPAQEQYDANADADPDAAPTLILASLVQGGRRGPRMLALEIDVRWVADVVGATRDDYPAPDVYGFVDPSGHVLLWDRSGSSRSIRMPPGALGDRWQLVRDEADAMPFTYRDDGSNGHVSGSFEVSATAIPSLGWASFAAARNDAASAIARNRTLRHLLAMGVTALAGIVSAAVLVHRMSIEASALERAAIQVRAGDLSARSGLQSASDIGAAGQAFDEMAITLVELEQSRLHALQVASHELRNPLSAVKGAASLLKMRMSESKDPRELMPLVDVMVRQSDDLAEKLTQIFDALIIANQWRVMDKRPVELRALIWKALQPFLDSPDGIRLVVCGLGDDLPRMVAIGDHDQLETVAVNLISNALKYSMGQGAIGVAVESHGNTAQLTVSDYGIGVPTAELSAIFDGFARGSNLEGRDPGGLGLGLYVSAMIVKQHGGRIWVESDEIAGTQFHVELPLQPAPARASSPDRSDANGWNTRCGGRR